MSSALVRQALELVDPEESVRGRGKKAKRPVGQGRSHPFKNKKIEKVEKSADKLAEENIRKLLALSQPTADLSITKKIVTRATGRKPLIVKRVDKKEEIKSVLFPEDEEPGKSILFAEEGDGQTLQDEQHS